MQVESLGGKIYVFMYVDDLSRYTWVNFIREKYDNFDIFQRVVPTYSKRKREWNWNMRHALGIWIYEGL